ncbi:DUF2332 domain-containing protein [Streptomyces oceani]|uniref:DUF2332 domain-containing protein n=1 Tax=Streptomyces oceani TaxID=1075402 RepID=A0A1E7JY23_9ACTN|nr:DUF2332 domain-containing protein [Streptomyces oceani]OEU96578.1 hypothetical protein AN216_20145 [Streptomyces oceani]
MSRERAAEMIEWQARACAELGSPLYAELLPRVAEDVRAGGVCARAVTGHEDAPGPDAIALRLLGGVHALVLAEQAPELAAHYPSAGGEFRTDRRDTLWHAFRDTVGGALAHVRDWLDRPPQTNEVGRANVLLPGTLRAAARHPLPIRLFELGASAGLNLRADLFRYSGGAGAERFDWGPESSPVQLSDGWRQPVPEWLTEAARAHPTLEVVQRGGCDLSPVDPLSPDGALALRAYVWPDQCARAARLDGALALAAEEPAEVERCGVAEYLAGVELRPGTLTVVWHSVMRQYVPAEEWARVERDLRRLAAASGPDAAFAQVGFEPRRAGERRPFTLSVRVDAGPEEWLAEAAPHGLPARGTAPTT